MIDKRLIDYSREYKDYETDLEIGRKHLSLENLISLLDVFLFDEKKDLSDGKYDAVISELRQARNTYHLISTKC
jgi:hypothetical protein